MEAGDWCKLQEQNIPGGPFPGDPPRVVPGELNVSQIHHGRGSFPERGS